MSQRLVTLASLLLIGLLLCGFAGPAQATDESTGTPLWVWLLIIAVLLFALLLWWLWWSRRGKEEELPVAERKLVAPVRAAEVQVPEVPARAAEVVPPKPDDLEIIEGIGPKIAGLLKAAGITTFTQLAEVDLGRVQEILRAANLRLADPTTWAEQAKLAAAGDWAGLETLAYLSLIGGHSYIPFAFARVFRSAGVQPFLIFARIKYAKKSLAWLSTAVPERPCHDHDYYPLCNTHFCRLLRCNMSD